MSNMVNGQFEEAQPLGSSSGSFQSRQILGVPATPGMVRLLGKLGVRDEKIAGYILITIAIVAFIVSIFIFAKVFTGGAGGDASRVGPPAGEI